MNNAKQIGIVGYGVVGKSALRYLRSQNSNQNIFVWDGRELSRPEQQEILNQGAQFVPVSESLEKFLSTKDMVVVSPGVDMRPYAHHYHKFVSELDLFASAFTKKIIAITGTLGKTTTTRLTGVLLPFKNLCGGNLGRGMLDLIVEQNDIDWAVLEVSSFQLEYCTAFAPDIALWTNFYPNHLDRHTTLQEYFQAKSVIFKNQKAGQFAIVPYHLFLDYSKEFQVVFEHSHATRCIVVENQLSSKDLSAPWLNGCTLYFVHNNKLYKAVVHAGALEHEVVLFPLQKIPTHHYLLNWLCALAAVDCAGGDVAEVEKKLASPSFELDHHRLELVATLDGIDFYDDSKATVIQATQAAVEKLAGSGRPLIVIVGGLSKGTDRMPLVNFLKSHRSIKKVFRLGDASSEFSCFDGAAALCELMQKIKEVAHTGDQILFSPSGSSFDLFENYKVRGDAFKKAVLEVFKKE